MNLNKTNISENVYNIYDAHILVPKKFAQKARQYLSNENIFLNHKPFQKGLVKETKEEALGIPIKYFKVTEENLHEKCENDKSTITICKNLAKHLSINQDFLEIKLTPTNACEIKTTNIDELQSKHKKYKGKYSPSSYDKLRNAYKEAKRYKDDNTQIDEDYTPKHWEIHDDLILFPPNSFKDIFEDQNTDEKNPAYDKLCDSICDIYSIKRIAIKRLGGIKNDDFRSPSVALIHGFCDNRKSETYSTWAKRTENGIIQSWDITKSMFCVGNITEKLRIASLDCKNEVVVDLFAGIGYFVLPYLIHAKAKHVFACEWNPTAVEALRRNLILNGVNDSKYTILEGDNRIVAPSNIADRVNLGLIPTADISYKTAVFALKDASGGILHIHGNVRRSKATKDSSRIFNCKSDNCGDRIQENKNKFVTDKYIPTVDQILFHSNPIISDTKYEEWIEWSCKTAEKIGRLLILKDREKYWELTLMHIEHVKAFAPFVDHLVLDLKCTPIDPSTAVKIK